MTPGEEIQQRGRSFHFINSGLSLRSADDLHKASRDEKCSEQEVNFGRKTTQVAELCGQIVTTLFLD